MGRALPPDCDVGDELRAIMLAAGRQEEAAYLLGTAADAAVRAGMSEETLAQIMREHRLLGRDD